MREGFGRKVAVLYDADLCFRRHLNSLSRMGTHFSLFSEIVDNLPGYVKASEEALEKREAESRKKHIDKQAARNAANRASKESSGQKGKGKGRAHPYRGDYNRLDQYQHPRPAQYHNGHASSSSA